MSAIEPKSVIGWAERIRPHLGRAVSSLVAAGRELIDAKDALPHGKFGDLLDQLGLHERAAQRMMQVARHGALANPSHATHLPADYTTLASLAQLPDEIVEELLEHGEITPGLGRQEAKVLVARFTTTPEPDLAARRGVEVDDDLRQAAIDETLRRGEIEPEPEMPLPRRRPEQPEPEVQRVARRRKLAAQNLAYVRSTLSALGDEFGVPLDDLATLIPDVDESLGWVETNDALEAIAVAVLARLTADQRDHLALDALRWRL